MQAVAPQYLIDDLKKYISLTKSTLPARVCNKGDSSTVELICRVPDDGKNPSSIQDALPGWSATFLRAQPVFSSIIMTLRAARLKGPVVKIIFPDGSNALYKMIQNTEGPATAFVAIPGSARDKDGNPVADPDGSSSAGSSSGSGGGYVGGTASVSMIGGGGSGIKVIVCDDSGICVRTVVY